MPRPDLTRVPDHFHNYINQAEGDDLMDILKKQTLAFKEFLNDIPKSKRNYRYAEDKWTIKELLQHIIDTERIFNYRALCFARKDATPLPGFEENDYAVNSKAEQRKWKDLVKEFEAVRRSTEILFDSFDEEQLETAGTANGKSYYVLAIGFVIAGHANHHIKVVKEKYLISEAN
jgi:arsenate reductase-like glutaredoxin family protein